MKKKPYRQLGGVQKRCAHSEKDQRLCSCPWFFMVTHGGGRHRGKIPGASTEDEARTAFQLIAARVRNGLPPFEPAPTTGTTISQLADDWLSVPRQRKASVIEGYQQHLNAHIGPALGAVCVTAVTQKQCEYFVKNLTRKQRSNRPLSLTTRQSIAMTLQTLLGFAKKTGLRPDNPAYGLPASLLDPDAKPDDAVIDPQDHTKYFTAEEAQHVLATCREHFPTWYPFVLTGFQTGMRLGELVALTYGQINWRGGYVTVNRAFVHNRPTTPKNGKTRTVSMSRDLRAVLYMLWRIERRKAQPNELIFPSHTGTPMDRSGRLARFWSNLLIKAERGYRTRHAMRHTHTSLLLQAGESPAKVAAEAGRSVQETMRTYAHFLPGGNHKSAELLSSLLSGRPAKDTVAFRPGISGIQRPRAATNLRLASRVS